LVEGSKLMAVYKQHATRYILTVWVTVKHDDEDSPVESGKEVADRLGKILRKSDLDAECELSDGAEEVIEELVEERDEQYEREAARARNNDFADTGGKDWT
jgi:hypothetical protein